MTVEFMSSQSPRLQDHLFDIWTRLQRDPTGSHYRSTDIADAMILEALAAPPTIPDDLCAVSAESPRWYRRYRVGSSAKTRGHSRSHQKKDRPGPAAPELDNSIPK